MDPYQRGLLVVGGGGMLYPSCLELLYSFLCFAMDPAEQLGGGRMRMKRVSAAELQRLSKNSRQADQLTRQHRRQEQQEAQQAEADLADKLDQL